MFGRLLEYLARLWLTLTVPGGRGQRFSVGAVVVNLTGRGDSSQRMEMAAVGMRLELGVPEKNLAEEDAAATLEGIGRGSLDRCLLPWIPLMRGGQRADIIERWKVLAASDPDGGGARTGAGWYWYSRKPRPLAPWQQALEGWNDANLATGAGWQEAAAHGRAEGKAGQKRKRARPRQSGRARPRAKRAVRDLAAAANQKTAKNCNKLCCKRPTWDCWISGFKPPLLLILWMNSERAPNCKRCCHLVGFWPLSRCPMRQDR
jgi:hypothetical protein